MKNKIKTKLKKKTTLLPKCKWKKIYIKNKFWFVKSVILL